MKNQKHLANFLELLNSSATNQRSFTATQMASSLFRLVVSTIFLDFDFPESSTLIPSPTLLFPSSILHLLLLFLYPLLSPFLFSNTHFSSSSSLPSLRRHCSTGGLISWVLLDLGVGNREVEFRRIYSKS